MWIVELNIAGHQFTHRVHDRRRPFFRFSKRGLAWRPSPVQHPHAA